MTNDADYHTRPESCRKAADKRPTSFLVAAISAAPRAKCARAFFNCLTGGHVPHQWKKCPTSVPNLPTKSFTSRSSFYNLISLNY